MYLQVEPALPGPFLHVLQTHNALEQHLRPLSIPLPLSLTVMKTVIIRRHPQPEQGGPPMFAGVGDGFLANPEKLQGDRRIEPVVHGDFVLRL